MDFIVVLAKVYPKNGCKDSIIEISEELIEKTREEDGNIEYQLLMSLNDNTLTFVEKWETLDDLKKHMASPHFQSFGEETKDFVEKTDDKISDANSMTIKELEYYDFESESLVKAEKPVEAKVDLTQSFTFKGGSGVEVKFTIPDIPDTKTTLKLSSEDLTVTVGEEKEFTVSLAYSDGTEKAATSITTDCNASETATVISEGGKIKVLGLAAGSVEVTVTSEGITQVFKFTVKAKEVTLTKVEFKDPPAELGVGKEASFEAYLVYSDGTKKPVSASTIKVSCSPEDVASVAVSSAKDDEIIVKGIKAGEATIKVWPTDNEKLVCSELLELGLAVKTDEGIKPNFPCLTKEQGDEINSMIVYIGDDICKSLISRTDSIKKILLDHVPQHLAEYVSKMPMLLYYHEIEQIMQTLCESSWLLPMKGGMSGTTVMYLNE